MPIDETDKIVNPYNSEAARKSGLSPSYTTVAEKRIMYDVAVANNEFAYVDFKKRIPLDSPGAKFNDVEFIAGLWRVQNKQNYDTINIRDKKFVLADPLDRIEHTHFEFYLASSVIWGGYGQHCSESKDYVVAKYQTGRGTFYAYGCKLSNKDAIATARAHLAGQIYMEYQDLIEAHTIWSKKQEATRLKNLKQFLKTKEKTVSKTENTIVCIQGKKFRLLKKLNRKEYTHFEFYSAQSVDGWSPDYIVAKYRTGRGTFYAYGCKITEPDALATARAHLAGKVYTAYQDLIEADTIRVLGKQK